MESPTAVLSRHATALRTYLLWRLLAIRGCPSDWSRGRFAGHSGHLGSDDLVAQIAANRLWKVSRRAVSRNRIAWADLFLVTGCVKFGHGDHEGVGRDRECSEAVVLIKRARGIVDGVDNDGSDCDLVSGDGHPSECVVEHRCAESLSLAAAINGKASEDRDRNRVVAGHAFADPLGRAGVLKFSSHQRVVGKDLSAVIGADERSGGVTPVALTR